MGKLTDVAIRNLKPKDRTYEVFDGHGLFIEVRPSGGKSWRYRYSMNGRLEKVSIGRYPAMSLAEARRRHMDMMALVQRGTSPAEHKRGERRQAKTRMKVRTFGEKFFEPETQRVRKNPKTVLAWLKKEIYPAIGERYLQDVTVDEVRQIVFAKRDAGFPTAAAGIRDAVKRLYDLAIARGMVDMNPAAAIQKRFVATNRPRTRNLDQDELRAFLTALYQANIRRQFKLALHLITLTMVRKSELTLAKWEHVDFDNAEWHIPQPKNERPHIVYLSRQSLALFAELKQLAGPSEWVMPGRRGPHKPFADNVLNRALDGLAVEIPAFTIHDLRRTASTRLHEAGFNSDVIEKALNHTIGGVRGIYNRAQYADQRREMLQFWADYIDSLMTEQKVIIGQFHRATAS